MIYPNLIAEMARAKITKADIAKTLGVSLKTVYIKLERGTMYLSEAMKIRKELFPNLDLLYLFAEEPEVVV